MRFREDKPADLERARAAVARWREQHPAGIEDQMIAALGSQFHPSTARCRAGCWSRSTGTAPATSQGPGLCPAPAATTTVTAANGTPMNPPSQPAEVVTLEDVRRQFGDRWEITRITTGYPAVIRDTGGHTPVPRYGRTPGELAGSIRMVEAAPRPAGMRWPPGRACRRAC